MKEAYFRKVDRNNLLIIVLEDATDEEYEEVKQILNDMNEYQYLLSNDKVKFIEVPRDADIKVINIKNKKHWWNR